VATLTAQLPNILSDHSYINFHTVQFPGGEIRGTINVVPEPSSVVLLTIGGAAGLGWVWLRRAIRR
jgi:CHRD domain-containing protein/PEP-CTERM motif-containing protein